jgi:beta-alanine degradation protein BauB
MATTRAAADRAPPANPRAHWPTELQQELEENRYNPTLGSVLVSETDKVRVWHLTIPAGQRCTFHRATYRAAHVGGAHMSPAICR